MEPVQSVQNQAKSDAAAHGIAHVMGLVHAQIVHHSQNVAYPEFEVIIFGAVGFVAAAVPSGVDQDQPVVLLQLFDEAVGVPGLQAVGESVLHHQRRAVSLNVKVNLDA